MVADIINSHMKNNFLTALPSVFDKLTDENGYSMDVKESDIKDTYVARNGLVYVSNKVFAPQDYKTVMGPAKIDVNNSLFSQAIPIIHTMPIFFVPQRMCITSLSLQINIPRGMLILWHKATLLRR